MKEEWKEIQGYEGLFIVSNTGRIISLQKQENTSKRISIRREKDVKIRVGLHGYCQAAITKNGKTNYFLVHRLVAIAFVKNPENKPQVNHKSGIKTDNRAENLEWCTRKENIQHAFDTGLHPKGEDHYCAKLDKISVNDIRIKYIPRVYSTRMLAKEYSVSQTCIRQILKNKSWKNL